MPSGGPRRSRRDNGLTAADYAAVGDVDPRVGEHLLDVLAGAGIAAYLQPSADVHPFTRVNFLPSRPTDRLFVDRAHLGTAREHMRRLAAPEDRLGGDGPGTPGGDGPGSPGGGAADAGPTGSAPAAARPRGEMRSGPDFDAMWASIVAAFDSERAGGGTHAGQPPGGTAAGRLPGGTAGDGGRTADATGGTAGSATAAGGTAGDGGRTADATGGNATADRYPADATGWAPRADPTADRPLPGRWRGGGTAAGPYAEDEPPPSLLDGLDTFGAGLDDDDDSYHPPPPPPVPRPSWYTIVAVLGALAGLGVLVFPQALPVSAESALLLGLAGLLTGFAILVWRLRPGGDEEERDPDDGAVV